MEASSSSFTGFNQPFLVQPELWHLTVPHMSYRELVNVYVTAKFGDFAAAQDNFNYVKRIWCRQVSLITFVDTVYQAHAKKVNDAFSSLIDTRYGSEEKENNVNRFKNELFNSFESASNNPDYIEKIIMIIVEAGYTDVLEKLYSTGKLDIPTLDKAVKGILEKANRNEYENVNSNSADPTNVSVPYEVEDFNTEIIIKLLTYLRDLPNYKNYYVHWLDCVTMTTGTWHIARGFLVSELKPNDMINATFNINSQQSMYGSFNT